MARPKTTVTKKAEKKATVKTVNAAKAEEAAKSVEAVKVDDTAAKETVAAAEAGEETAAVVKPAEAEKAEVKPVKEAKEKKTRAAKVAKPAKETAEKKTRAAKAPSQTVVLQVNGREDLSMENLIDRVKAAYAAEGHSVDSIKDIEVYIKLNENMAYYVIDGYASGISLY